MGSTSRAACFIPWLCIFAALQCAPVERTSAAPSRLDAGLDEFLAHGDAQFDPRVGLLRERFRNPGYHSRVPSGETVHPTRESLYYAVALLQRGDADDVARAVRIVRTILPLQDADGDSPTHGVWPWLYEEPLEEMADPDLNWADFCGSSLAQVLARHSAALPGDLRDEVRAALRRAAEAIRARDVGPAYTNIAILGGGVCAAAGELLDDDDLLAYGRDRLRKVVAHTARHGSFNEYNSPPYTTVALLECERTLMLVRDPATRAAAESLRRTAWKIIAGSFHPGTQQWAGPHSRNSRDRLRRSTVDFLRRRMGEPIALHPEMSEADPPRGHEIVPPLPCPEHLADRFRRAPDDDPAPERQRVRTYIAGDTPDTSTIGTSWFAPDACLGSANRSTFWAQRRPLLGYWRTVSDPAVVFRARFLHDGRDFVSMGIRAAQRGPRVLAGIGSVAGRGDWHPSLDRPADGTFHVRDFRLRFELTGTGVHAEELGEGRYALVAGERRVVIHTRPSRFAGEAVTWSVGHAMGSAHVDAICHDGPPRAFDFRRPLDIDLIVGIELSTSDREPISEPPRVVRVDDAHRATWPTPAGEPLSLNIGPESFEGL
ncbi:MAG: hypothetical protein WD066_13105 [Planctomycetaceae bacterium]